MNNTQKKGIRASLSLDINLRKELELAIKTWEKRGRYETYSSFIGKAIISYLNNELIIKDFETGKKMSYYVILEPEVINFYQSLPNRKRYKVINSILKSYLDKELLTLN